MTDREGLSAKGAGDPGEPGGGPPDHTPGEAEVGWPVELSGVTESVVATRGPDGRWNLAALGLQAPDRSPSVDGPTGGEDASAPEGEAPVTARTWGRTRTRINFEREGEGVVQFTRDPGLFVEAALGIEERKAPVDPGAAAWARVAVQRVDAGESGGTEWADWRLTPTRRGTAGRTVPTIDRGFSAVIEATVAASRLDVPAYDEAELLDRLRYFESVVETAGSPAERAAFDRIDDLVGWTDRR